VTPITPAAASKVRPSGLGCEGVIIFGALLADASIWIIQSNGHGAQDACARLCTSFSAAASVVRQEAAATGHEAAGDRFTISAHDEGLKASIMLVMNLFGAEVVEL
jgi:hypothetical protein